MQTHIPRETKRFFFCKLYAWDIRIHSGWWILQITTINWCCALRRTLIAIGRQTDVRHFTKSEQMYLSDWHVEFGQISFFLFGQKFYCQKYKSVLEENLHQTALVNSMTRKDCRFGTAILWYMMNLCVIFTYWQFKKDISSIKCWVYSASKVAILVN